MEVDVGADHKLLKKRQIVQKEGGSTLLEIVILVLVVSIAIFPLSRLAVKNLKSFGGFATIGKAIFHAEAAMEEVIADYAATGTGRGYDWVRSYWSGHSTSDPPPGVTGIVSISQEFSLDSVDYVIVQVTVSGTDIPDVSLSTWLTNNN